VDEEEDRQRKQCTSKSSDRAIKMVFGVSNYISFDRDTKKPPLYNIFEDRKSSNATERVVFSIDHEAKKSYKIDFEIGEEVTILIL
jgi:hypothetical protein